MGFDKLCSMISNISSKSEEIFPESRLSSDLGLCSFDIMMLIFQIEEICGNKVCIFSIKKDMTVKELYDLISK
ncbi:MAG: hypothetical protein NC452_10285 [Eubacterium sp.]|nr:hypothetical protein [Eubacterium sp.]